MVDIEQDIRKCVEVLQAGGVILYPTDTIWGLGCDATNSAAIEKIFTIKQRPLHKTMIILLADERDLFQYVAAPPITVFELLEQFSQPTTLIYENGLGVANNALHGDGSIAIRVTKDPFCKALIKRFRKPIVSTSANISESPPPAYFTAIDPHLIAATDYVVHHRRADETPTHPSAIFKIDDDGKLISLR